MQKLKNLNFNIKTSYYTVISIIYGKPLALTHDKPSPLPASKMFNSIRYIKKTSIVVENGNR